MVICMTPTSPTTGSDEPLDLGPIEPGHKQQWHPSPVWAPPTDGEGDEPESLIGVAGPPPYDDPNWAYNTCCGNCGPGLCYVDQVTGA